MPEIYDSVFRTEINDCSQFLLPFLNETFGENYNGDEKIVFHVNEHYIKQEDKNGQKRITDTNFTVYPDNKRKKEYHLECESSEYSAKLLIRIFEYDAQIALDHHSISGDTMKVTFPHAAVLCLRNTKSTPDKMKIVIEVPGGKVEYDVPVITLSYTAEEIFKKKLYLLIPFYIFRYEKCFDECNIDNEKYEEMKKEFQYISDELDKLSDSGEISSYDRRVIRELSKEVIEFIAVKYSKVKKGIGDIMCGPMIETDARKFVKIGEEKGRKEGEEKGRKEGMEKGRKEGRKEGIEKGRKEGMKKGRKEGIEKGRKEMIEVLRASGVSEELIQKALEKLEEKSGVK